MQFSILDERWLPKSVLCLRDYNRTKFLHDLIAGITVGLVALPLAMAFAIASGFAFMVLFCSDQPTRST